MQRCGPLRAIPALLMTAALAACGGSDSSVEPTPEPPPPDPLAAFKNQSVAWLPCDPSILGEGNTFLQDLGARATCADIRVPLDYTAPERGQMSVALLRVAAESPERRLGALLFNPGGPGGDGLFLPALMGSLWTDADPATPQGALRRDMTARYDLIGFSPRGTGASTALVCESNELLQPIRFASDDRSPGNIDNMLYNAWLTSRTCLKNPITPFINTEQTVQDMDLIRHLANDEKLNFIGYSYGTWLGNWYAARFPERVGRMLIDSNMNFTRDYDNATLESVRGKQRVLDEIIAPFAARYPQRLALGTSADDVRAVFGSLLSPLKQHLHEVLSLGHSSNAPDVAFNLAGTRIADAIIRAYPDAQPARIQEIIQAGQFAPAPANEPLIGAALDAAYAYFRSFEPQRREVRLSREDATYAAVVCNDATSITDPTYWVDKGNEYALKYPLDGGGVTANPCITWGGPVVDKPTISQSAQAGTIVMLQSQFDALTPAEGALEMFEQLPQARLVYVQGEYTHGLFPYETACVDEPIFQYFLTGEAPPRRTDCAGKPLPWDAAQAATTTRRTAPREAAAEPSPYRNPERAREIRERIQDILTEANR